MQIYKGIYTKAIKKTNCDYPSVFTLTTNQGRNIKCAGQGNLYAIGTPLEVEGTWTEDNFCFRITKVEVTDEDGPLLFQFFTKNMGLKNRQAVKLQALFESHKMYDYIEQKDAVAKIAIVLEKTEDETKQFIEDLKSQKAIYDLMNDLKDTNCIYKDISKIRKAFGNRSESVIRNNPYVLISKCKLSFEKADNIAKKYGKEANDEERLKYMVRKAFESVMAQGHTRATLRMLGKKMYSISKHSAYSDYLFNKIAITDMLLSSKEYVYKDGFFYLRKYYRMEKCIAHNIRRLQNTAIKYLLTDSKIPLIERKLGIQFDESQKEAITLIRNGGLCILTGPPGSGKTSTIKGIIEGIYCVKPNAQIRLAATTGCAAQRMLEQTGMYASTANAMLEPLPETQLVPSRNKNNPLEQDIYIVDEVSMADTELMHQIFEAIPDGALVILVGDEHQLKSVGPGKVLHDLIESGVVPVYRLNCLHRQKSGSLIPTLAQTIDKGSKQLQIDNKNVYLYNFQTAEQARKYLEMMFVKKFKKEDYKTYSFLSFVKKGEAGCEIINRIIHNLNFEGKSGFTYDNVTFCKNERIMFNRNNAKTGYCNGDMGIVESYDAEGMYILMDFGKHSKESVYISGDDLDDIEIAYAKTVHKAQGSEADYIILLVPDYSPTMLRRDLLYTGVTRAKKGLLILNVQDSLYRCIDNTADVPRETGLQDRIKEIMF